MTYVFASPETTAEDFLTMLRDHNVRIVRQHLTQDNGQPIYRCAVEDLKLEESRCKDTTSRVSHGTGKSYVEAACKAINKALEKRARLEKT